MHFKIGICLVFGLAVGLLHFVSVVPAAADQADKTKALARPFRADDAFDEEELGAPRFAPDGRALAFTKRRPSSSQPTNGLWIPQTRDDVWVQLAPGEAATTLTNGAADRSGWWNPRWSPDGRYLSYLSTRGGTVKAWVWKRATNKARVLPAEGIEFSERPFAEGEPGGCRWVGSKALLCLVMPERQPGPPMTDGARAIERANAEWAKAAKGEASATVMDSLAFHPAWRQLTMIDVQKPTPATAAFLGERASSIWISPNGKAVAFVEPEASPYSMLYRFRMGYPARVRLLRLDGRPTSLARSLPDNVLNTTIAWSPNSRELAFFAFDKAVVNPAQLYGEETARDVSHERVESVETQTRLWRISLDDGPVEQANTGDVDLGSELLPPAFLRTAPGELVFRARRLSPRATPHVDAKPDWLVLDARGATRPLLTQAVPSPATLESLEGGSALFGSMGGDVWRVDPQRGTIRKLTDGLERVHSMYVVDGFGQGLTVALKVGAPADEKAEQIMDLSIRSVSKGIREVLLNASEFHVNGQRNDSNYLMVDGVNGPTEMDGAGFQNAAGQRLSSTVTGTVNGGLSIDAVQEVRIQTSSFAAEFGRTPGGQISVITRSGTNRFSGSLFEQFRNDKLMANDWFANARGSEKPSIEEHQFHATFGGPVLRDRLFFFESYEGLSLDQPVFTRANVPSIEARNQASSIREVLNAYPLPTRPSKADMTTEHATYYGNRRSSDNWGIRVDQSVRSGTQVFGRYARVPSQSEDDSPFALMGVTRKRGQSITGGLTMTLGSRTLVDVRFGYADSLFRYDGGVSGPGAVVHNWLPASAPTSGILEFGVTCLASLWSGNRPGNEQRHANAVASLSHVRGAHTFKTGFDYRCLTPDVPADYSLTARFSNMSQALAGTTLAALNVTRIFPLEGTFENYSLYVQDDWKVRPQVSVTDGLRWDINPAPSFPSGHGPFAVADFEPVNQLSLSGERNVPLWKTDYGNLFPRLGLTHSLDKAGRTVLSGGLGLFGDLSGATAAAAALTARGTRAAINRTNVALPLVDSDTRGLEAATIARPLTESGVYVVDPELETPRTTQWNVTLQRALTSQQTLSVSYVGAKGERLLQRTQYRRGLNPNFVNDFNVLTAGGESRYHAAQIQYRPRMARRIQSLVSYTYGAARDTSSGYLTSDREWAPSNFDLRHSANGAVSWDLPSARGPIAWTLKDWAMHVFASALRLPVHDPLDDRAAAEQGTTVFQRASTVPGVPIVVDEPAAPGVRRFNDQAFVNPVPTEQGNTGRNEFRAFSVFQMDMAFQRVLSVGESAKVRVRVEPSICSTHRYSRFPSMQSASRPLASPRRRSTRRLADSIDLVGREAWLSRFDWTTDSTQYRLRLLATLVQNQVPYGCREADINCERSLCGHMDAAFRAHTQR